MNRRPLIPVRSFKTDDYRTSLAIGPKDTPGRFGQEEQFFPYKLDPNREEKREEERRRREEEREEERRRREEEREKEREEQRRQREKYMKDKRQFDSMMNAIEREDIGRFKNEFSRAGEDVKMMRNDDYYEDYRKDEEDEEDDEIFYYQTLLTHAFVYNNPEIFQILLVNHIDNGIDFVETAIKKGKKGEVYLPRNSATMRMMLKDYNQSINTALDETQETKKRNALRRLQRRDPKTGKVSGKRVSTEEWNAEKGIGNNITSLF